MSSVVVVTRSVVLLAASFVAGTVYPAQRELIAAVTIVVLLAACLLALNARVRGLVAPRRSRFEDALRASERRPGRPDDLERCERGLGWRVYSPRDFDHHVRPLLRALILHRVKDRLGIDLEAVETPAAGAVDAELLALAGGEKADALYDRNIDTRDIARVVGRLEAL
jgi:hypothetical protein